MKGGSEFDENDFLVFAEKMKEFTYNTYLVSILNRDDEDDYIEHVKTTLTDYKEYIKDTLLDSYNKKSKFDELNKLVVSLSKNTRYKSLAFQGKDDEYDFAGFTEKVLKKIDINYSSVTPEQLQSIRNVLEQSSRPPSRTSSRTPSRTSSISSRRSSISSMGRTRKRKKRSKKRKKRSKKRKKRSKKRSRSRNKLRKRYRSRKKIF